MAEWRVAGFDEVRELGRGGQGRVVLARHAGSGTPVAIKYLPADADPDARARFRDEARMLGQVDDPHVARLFRLVEHDDDLAIVMEAVDGVSFKEILGRYGRLEPEAALTVLRGSLLGLAAAHAVGVVHRDYKPANVIVPADGRSKLIDFGIAAPEGAAPGGGTPLYMAPEQWRGEPATPAADVYAATCVFFEALTGRRPYGAGDRASIMAGHLSGDVPAEDAPEPLRPLVAQGMAKDPADRPASAAAFVAELDELARTAYGPDWEARGVRALAGTAVALAALFPLAAGLAPAAGAGAGAGAAAGSSGILAAVGAKAAVAVAGTAVVGATAGGIGVYEATKEDRPPAAVRADQPLPGVPLRIGQITLKTPAFWKTYGIPFTWTKPNGEEERPPSDSFYVSTWRTCSKGEPVRASLSPGQAWCPGVHVLGRSFLDDSYAYVANRYSASDTYASMFSQDEGMSCPEHEDLRAVGVQDGARLTVNRLADVGSKKAEYREWVVPCYTRDDPSGYGPNRRTRFTYTERLWYLPVSKVLIVDIWNTPNLARMLQHAEWA
ncbi:serine/threonine-protein kinase [Actinomadura syzygii]|uniref:non-specific serine/threonine protein kinase n=1 Tax=Actinomadura syzygii TaxID=1427538 RepID=A0A5D0U3L7_9ACTN|nr:serine/threonine-protein kinase [Actinomadura syzygii]TYC12320.1 serine/threonine protein kinase [Actinomadura syzygii]